MRIVTLPTIIAAGITAGVGAASSALAEQIEGMYRVPAGYGLETPLDVPLRRSRITIDGNEVTFDYRLPKELDGPKPKRFRLSGLAQGEQFDLTDASGDRVTATCLATSTSYECSMKYKQPFTVNVAGALQYLESSGADSEQIARFQAGSVSLQHQAAGIVTIPRR